VYMETVRRDRSEGPEMVAMLRATGARACVAIPIVASGAVAAVLGLFFAVPRPFSAYERELIEMIAQQGGPALDRARRQELDQRARALAEAEKRRSSFLAEASAEMTSTLDGARTLESVVRIAVPYLADACAIDLRGDDGSIARAAVAHADLEREAWLRELLRARPIDPEGTHPIAVVARTGRATLVNRPDLEEGAQPWTQANEAAWDLLAPPIVSSMIVPLVVGDKTLGTLTFASESASRIYRPVDLALAESLAHRAALAIENAHLYQAAQRAIRSRDEILAIVSHDLRNPLGVIKTLVGGLRRSLPDEPANERVLSACEAIRRSTDRMNRLIDDLLDVAGIEAGKLSVSLAPHDVAALVNEAVNAILPLAAAKEIAIHVDVASPLRARCDRARILQVLANLLGNAVKFTPERGGAIRVGAERDGDDVRITVEDRGPGIAPEDLPHVFDRYWQAKSASRAGAGLGLAIVKGIVDAHGGRVHVESVVGHGASFVLSVPLAGAAERPASAPPPGRS
jgi:signal transduction histidine kinase